VSNRNDDDEMDGPVNSSTMNRSALLPAGSASSNGAPAAPAIEIDQVAHAFRTNEGRNKVALRDVTFGIERSTLVAVVGPSGCGKSTLLNLISGLLFPTRGSVRVNGQQVTQIRHDVGYMPSQSSLLPWRTVENNVALALELAGMSRKKRLERAHEMIAAVGLAGNERAYPHQLSQGMQQRVAIARTFCADSDIILMDEPFSALDAQTRVQVQDLFLSIWEQRKPTVVLITHDVAEAVALADRVVVFSKAPGTVLWVSDITLPRPRSVEDLMFNNRDFQNYMRSIWASLRDESETVR
jgi:NitT/TauT family transport system ATP-binding protein